MAKLAMCRICLVEDVRMYVVVNKNLQELYGKLTDVPFMTEDCRPMLACFFCCAKLKQCEQFRKKCLQAEELFTQMLSDDCEQKFSNLRQSEFLGGFVRTPIENIDIIDVCETQNYTKVKEEPLEEESENYARPYRNQKNILPHNFETDSEDDVPLMEIKIEVKEEQEVCKKNRRSDEIESASMKKPIIILEDSTIVNQKTSEQQCLNTILKTKPTEFKESLNITNKEIQLGKKE